MHIIGSGTGGMDFNCLATGGATHCTAEHQQVSADGSNGFNGQYQQFELAGTASAVPLPAAVWLFGWGLAGLIVAGQRQSNGLR